MNSFPNRQLAESPKHKLITLYSLSIRQFVRQYCQESPKSMLASIMSSMFEGYSCQHYMGMWQNWMPTLDTPGPTGGPGSKHKRWLWSWSHPRWARMHQWNAWGNTLSKKQPIIWYDMVWYDMISHMMSHMVSHMISSMISYDMLSYEMLWNDMMWYDVKWNDMILYSITVNEMLWYEMKKNRHYMIQWYINKGHTLQYIYIFAHHTVHLYNTDIHWYTHIIK